MYLTDEEKRILQGERGEIAQKCMEFLVAYGEAAGAERLIDIDGTVNLHPGAHWVEDFKISNEEILELIKKGERFKVPTFSDKPTVPGFIYDGFEDAGVLPASDPDFRKSCLENLEPWIKMGMVPTFSCTHYLVASTLPSLGQHCAWVESSAIPWANAILGARSNFDGCFQTAYLGKVPAYDMHLDENRIATILVECAFELKTDMDYDLFGWAVGEACGLEVPALVGIGKPTTSQLVKMNSALNTGGQVRMYHIPGLTPEAPTLEAAFKGRKPKRRIVIEKSDLKRIYERLNTAETDDVDFVYLGCPHYNIQDLIKVARLIEGKKCKVPLWVMTNPITFKLAEMMGIRDVIKKAGGSLLSGACPGLLMGKIPRARTFATDAAKQNYYITGCFYPEKLGVFYGSTEECIEAAIEGKWRGGWK